MEGMGVMGTRDIDWHGTGCTSYDYNKWHFPYLNRDTGTWFVWSAERGEYVNTEVNALGYTGPQGVPGEKGDTGERGTSVYVTGISESLVDGGQNTVTFSDGHTLAVRNGNSGSDFTGNARLVDEAFSAFTSYAVGDYCIYENKLYKCATAHTGVWDADHFQETNIGAELEKIKDDAESAGVDIAELDKAVSICYTLCGIESANPIDGYSELNTTVSTATSQPYIPAQDLDYDYVAVSFDINVNTAGTISIGTVAKSDISAGESYDATKFSIHETITIANTGYNRVKLSQPLLVKSTDYVVISATDDTVRFCYGANGTDKSFFYIASGKYATSGNSLGITINAFIKAE